MGEETRGWSGLVNPNILVGRLDEMKLSSNSEPKLRSEELRMLQFSCKYQLKKDRKAIGIFGRVGDVSAQV